MKILIGGISQEGDSFSPKKSELIPEHGSYLVGDEIPAAHDGGNSGISAYIRAAKEANADICYTCTASFISSGCVSTKAFETVAEQILTGIRTFKPDIILLNLHGACILEHYHDGEGLLLKMVREAAGEECIICSSFDMHAFMTFDMVSALDVFNGYKTYPHIDIYEQAYQSACYAIEKYRTGRKFYAAMTRVPMIVAAERGQTNQYPIGPIVDYANALEASGEIDSFALSVMQPWMNVPHGGCVASVCAPTPEAAVRVSRELAERLWAIRKDTQIVATPIAQAVERARELRGCGKPVIFVDSADSPGAGGTNDSSYVAKVLTENSDLRSIGTVVDKEVAAQAYDLPDGAEITCELGFKEAPMFGKPFTFKGVVERHCDPRIPGNLRVNFGKRVVLRCGEARVMVMENAGGGASPATYTNSGYQLEDFDIVCVRSALQYRELYEGHYVEDILVDSPGASNSNLLALPFDNLKWPVYPLQKDATFVPQTLLSYRK